MRARAESALARPGKAELCVAELGFDPDAMFDRLPKTVMTGGAMTGGDQAHQGNGHHGMSDPGRLQGYVWHCHLLDHEDHDMMLPYRIVP